MQFYQVFVSGCITIIVVFDKCTFIPYFLSYLSLLWFFPCFLELHKSILSLPLFRLSRYLVMNMNLQRKTYYMQKESLRGMVWHSLSSPWTIIAQCRTST